MSDVRYDTAHLGKFRPKILFKNQKERRRLAVFRLDALTGSLLTQIRIYLKALPLSRLPQDFYISFFLSTKH